MKIERFLVRLAVWVLFPKFFWQVKKWIILELDKKIKSFQKYEKWPFFSVFSHLGPFSQVFGQVKE